MIVLKATQDKVIAVLQSVAGIVERRHTLPILANVLIRRSPSNPLQLDICPLAREASVCHSTEVFPLGVRIMTKLKRALVMSLPRTSYFGSKVNGRNAP